MPSTKKMIAAALLNAVGKGLESGAKPYETYKELAWKNLTDTPAGQKNYEYFQTLPNVGAKKDFLNVLASGAYGWGTTPSGEIEKIKPPREPQQPTASQDKQRAAQIVADWASRNPYASADKIAAANPSAAAVLGGAQGIREIVKPKKAPPAWRGGGTGFIKK